MLLEELPLGLGEGDVARDQRLLPFFLGAPGMLLRVPKVGDAAADVQGVVHVLPAQGTQLGSPDAGSEGQVQAHVSGRRVLSEGGEEFADGMVRDGVDFPGTGAVVVLLARADFVVVSLVRAGDG